MRKKKLKNFKKAFSWLYFLRKLFESFFQTMYETGGDFTNCFRYLNRATSKDRIDEMLDLFLSFSSDAEELKNAFRPKFPKA
jgi:uncharacterized protein YdiU (UPF0061 family)